MRDVVARVGLARVFAAAAVRPRRDALGELSHEAPVRAAEPGPVTGKTRTHRLGEVDETAAARVPPARARDVAEPPQEPLARVPGLPDQRRAFGGVAFRRARRREPSGEVVPEPIRRKDARRVVVVRAIGRSRERSIARRGRDGEIGERVAQAAFVAEPERRRRRRVFFPARDARLVRVLRLFFRLFVGKDVRAPQTERAPLARRRLARRGVRRDGERRDGRRGDAAPR